MSAFIHVMEMPITWYVIVAAIVTAGLLVTYISERNEQE